MTVDGVPANAAAFAAALYHAGAVRKTSGIRSWALVAGAVARAGLGSYTTDVLRAAAEEWTRDNITPECQRAVRAHFDKIHRKAVDKLERATAKAKRR